MLFSRYYSSIFLIAGILCGVGLATVHAQGRTQRATYVTRLEAAQLLLKRSNKIIPNLVSEGEYPDVIDGEPYTKYVLYAAKIGMWEPDPSINRLRPHKLITRGEYLKMLATVFLLPLNLDYDFKDVQPEDWSNPFAGIAQRYSLFYDPRDPNRLRAELPITHEEAATALFALFAQRVDLRPPQRIRIYRVVYENTDDSRAQGEEPDRDMLHSYMTVTSRNQIRDSLQQEKGDEKSNADIIQDEIIAAVNRERAKENLSPLAPNMALRYTAILHAKDMYQNGYFSHYSPEGRSFIDRIKESGYTDVDPIECGCKQVLVAPTGEDTRDEIRPDYVEYSRNVCQCQPKFALGENLAKGQLRKR